MKPIAKQQRIWVTGATSGIGEALSHELASCGHTVIATGRNQDALNLLGHYDNIHTYALDITDTDALTTFSKHVEEKWGAIDTAVVNAGICEYVKDLPSDPAMWQRVYEPNLLGAMQTIDTALTLMAKSDYRGQIVGVLSQVIFAPFSQAEFYGATKAALDYYLKALRIDVKKSEIDICAIYPGFVATPLTDRNPFDMPFIVSAQDAARKMATAMSKRKRQYIFPKQLYYVLKVSQIFPGLWDKMFADKSRIELKQPSS